MGQKDVIYRFKLAVIDFLKNQKMFSKDLSEQWRSRGASGGTRPVAQALRAHQHTYCKHLNTRFK